MSTRCQVIVQDSFGPTSAVWLYRHSDGYPENMLPILQDFLSQVEKGVLRDNAEQSAGWLIIMGHVEYGVPDTPDSKDDAYGWKVGAFEPCAPFRHGDTEYLYLVDVSNNKISVLTSESKEWDKHK